MTYTREEWSRADLAAIGNTSPTIYTLDWVIAWTQRETGPYSPQTPGAAFNLTNTTEPWKADGTAFKVTPFNNLANGQHVWNYASFADGIAANAKVLKNGDYPTLLHALQTNDETVLRNPPQSLEDELHLWGTGRVGASIAQMAGNPSELRPDEQFPGDMTPAPAPPPQVQPQGGSVITVNKNGEVADFLDVTQFIAGRSPDECVAYSGSLLKFSGEPGKGPTGSTLQASNLAQFWYGKEEGSTLSSNRNGMDLLHEHDMLTGMGMTWINVAPDISLVKAWLEHGYPLLICGSEAGMHDMELGDTVPYPWSPITGNHAIVASGVSSDGNLLVHDCANVTSANAIRPGPRKYDASKLQLISATVIVKHWLPMPAANFDPRVKALVLPVELEKAGWTYTNNNLYAPAPHNTIPIPEPFATHIMERNPLRPDDYPLAPVQALSPLELSNPKMGNGNQLAMRWLYLETKAGDTKVIEVSTGQELYATRNKLNEALTKLNALIAQVQSQQPPQAA